MAKSRGYSRWVGGHASWVADRGSWVAGRGSWVVRRESRASPASYALIPHVIFE